MKMKMKMEMGEKQCAKEATEYNVQNGMSESI